MNNFHERLNRHVDDATPDYPKPFDVVIARRDLRRRRRRTLAASGTAMLAVAAIAIGTQLAGRNRDADNASPSTSTPTPTATERQRPEPTYEWSIRPSPVILRLADRDIELTPWSSCWTGPTKSNGTASGLCADGFAPTRDLESVGSPGSVDFWFGVPDWDFTATFTELGVDCPRQHTVAAVSTGDQTFLLRPAGPAGRYRIDLFGNGRHGVATSFLWSTTADGPSDQPKGDIELISGDGDDQWAFNSRSVCRTWLSSRESRRSR